MAYVEPTSKQIEDLRRRFLAGVNSRGDSGNGCLLCYLVYSTFALVYHHVSLLGIYRIEIEITYYPTTWSASRSARSEPHLGSNVLGNFNSSTPI